MDDQYGDPPSGLGDGNPPSSEIETPQDGVEIQPSSEDRASKETAAWLGNVDSPCEDPQDDTSFAETLSIVSENTISSQGVKEVPAWFDGKSSRSSSRNNTPRKDQASKLEEPQSALEKREAQSKRQSMGAIQRPQAAKNPPDWSEDVPLTMSSEGGFHEEVHIGTEFLPEEVRIMVGRNRVRIVAEHSGKESVHKVVLVPSYIDSYSLRSVFRNGVVVITGSAVHEQRRWTIGENGHLAVREDGSVRMTLDLPAGVAADDVTVTTVTKRYLVVRSQGRAKDSEKTKSVLDTYELPNTCDVNSMKTRSLGENTLIVELGARCLRPRAYSY